jgi:Xaa-Pro aminopeptidase
LDHSLRRAALASRLEELGAEALLVTRLLNVRYLTGFTGSNALLLVSPDQTVFFTDGRYTEQSRREVPDLERITCGHDHRADVATRAGELGIARLAVESHEVTLEERSKLAEAFGDAVELVPVSGAVELLRSVKDDDERDLIRQAQAATDAAFEAVLDLFSVGVSEARIARELERLLREEGADALAFDPILAFGENAAEPHHEPGHRMLEEGDVVKLDFGGLVGGYHSDMTRTVAFGSPPAELRKIHDVVRESQQAGIDAVKAGVTGEAVDAACRKVIEDAGYGESFVHGTGHGVGLEIHEQPWLGKAQENRLPIGAVVTVEPGIYIPGLGGVRIEDMVEVTDEGAVVVGTSTRDLIEL